MKTFQPKLFTLFKNYSKNQFVNDVIAGIIIGTGVSAAVCFIKPKETLNKSY